MKAKDKLIVALDADTLERAEELVDILSPEVDIFKVGIAPFTGFGERLLNKLREKGKKVFLDLKFHDIPNTVKNAASAAAQKGVFMINFHCLGGREMLKAAAIGAKEGAASHGKVAPILLGVTILTSMDEKSMHDLGMSGRINDKVIELASLAKGSGMNGVVASAQEAAKIKKSLGEDFIVVTPGVRPAGTAQGDQKRIVTPKQAIENGADYIVVGRPIIQAEDPLQAAKQIIAEIEE